MLLYELFDDSHRSEIIDRFTSAGYHPAGEGMDAMVFVKDDSHVAKIIIPHDPFDLGPSVRAFMTFYNFCQQNPSRHLPEFSELNEVEVDGEDFVQIIMEKLHHIPEGGVEEAMIWLLSDAASKNLSWIRTLDTMFDLRTWQDYPGPGRADDTLMSVQNISQSELRDYGELYKLMRVLRKTAREQKLGWDLHTNNVMQRSDGTLVITDPWFSQAVAESSKPGVAEGKMAELDMDLEDPEISDKQFEKMYGMTRKEARDQFSQTDMWAFPELRDPNKPLHEQGVAEALNQPYGFKWEHNDESHDALVKLPDGSNLSMMFSLDYGAYGDEEWTVEFWRGNSQDVTGEGDQQRIFATVLEAIRQFIEMEHPERIRFSANKAVEPGQKSLSRTNLYNRLVQRYANSWGYSVDVDDFADTTVYNLYTMNESVAENFADGRKPGRKGLAKRMGVDCKQSISKLRSIAASSSGERQRMAHWCANMKSGKKK